MRIGAAVPLQGLDDPQFLETLQHADYLTPKWGIEEVGMSWQRLVALGKPIFAHALIPQNQNVPHCDRLCIHADPSCIPEIFDARLERLKDIKADVFGVTVVNEAWTDQGDYRKSYWFNTMGPDYIAEAFHRAHDIAPDLPLYYCDYRVWDDRKWGPILKELYRLKLLGVPIHGINLQLQIHLFPWPHLWNIRRRILEIQSLGFQAIANEVTVFMNFRSLGSWESRLQQQADTYHRILVLARMLGVSHLGFWCWCDRYQWHWVDTLEGTDAPGLFCENYQPKLAAQKVWQQSEM